MKLLQSSPGDIDEGFFGTRRRRLSPTRVTKKVQARKAFLQVVSLSRITRRGLMSSPPTAKLNVPAVSVLADFFC
ncbi:hypothetical protein L218DRAFT_961379 [Marasmius fiardii PR-910]|nr:hypothetical protein L218DRAFT_961379 [Marasmius fiardii PR-910]